MAVAVTPSGYAIKIRNAGTHRRPVLLFGEPGLEKKNNLAALVHFGSTSRREPMIQLDLQQAPGQRGRVIRAGGGANRALLAALGRGTLVLSDPKKTWMKTW